MPQLLLQPAGFFTSDWTVSDGDGQLARLDAKWTREGGTVELLGRQFAVGRDGFFSGTFTLTEDDIVIASAVKRSPLTRTFDLRLSDGPHVLHAASPFTRTFDLVRGDRYLGSLQPTGVFTRSMVADLPDSIPLEERIFVAWLVIVMWNRARNSG